MRQSRKILGTLILGASITTPVFATNGYAPHGIGMNSKGMGGVFIGYQGDSVALGGNPAGSAFIDDRFDIGLDLFSPDREATLSGNALPTPAGPFPTDGTYDGNDSDLFAIPELGYRKGLGNDMAFGLSVFGNGGMNTDYKDGIPLFNLGPTGTSERTGINLMQLFVVPNLSYKINPKHSFGVGLNLVAQSFEAEGLQNFVNFPGFSTDPTKVTNQGADFAYGAGLRLGWMGQITPQVTLGATYQTRTYMSEFDDYAGLFAEQGDFDVPSNFGVGIAFQATPQWLLAADVMQIQYSEVDSIGNKGVPITSQLGADNGPGFGWDDMTVIKLGVEFMVNPDMTLRAGYNHGDAPIDSSQTLFNVLAPATVEDHLTLGGTWSISPTMNLTAMYMHAFENEIKGSNSIPSTLGDGEADITMSQDSIGLAFSWDL